MRRKVKHTPSYFIGYIAAILDVLLYGTILVVIGAYVI